MIKTRSPYFIEIEEPSAPTILPRFTCEYTQITGLSIDASGNITNPTVSVGTLHSLEPTSFGTVPLDTLRTVLVYVTYDSNDFRPPTDTSNEIACPISFIQPATVQLAYQKNYRVTNNSTTENALINYISYSTGQEITHYLAPSSTVDICVAPVDNDTFGFPTVVGSDVTYFDLVQYCINDILS